MRTDRANRTGGSPHRDRGTSRVGAALVVAGLAVVSLALAGCGGGSSAAPSDETLPPAMAAETVAPTSTSTSTTRPTDERLEIAAAGVHQMDGEERWAANWAAVVRNTQRGAAAGDVTVTVDLVDADGAIVTTETVYLPVVWPTRSGAVTGISDAPGAVEARVSVEVGEWLDGYDYPLGLEMGPLTASERPRDFENESVSTTIAGTLTSSYPEDIGVVVTAVFRGPDGAVMGGVEWEIRQLDLGFYISPGQSLPWTAITPLAIPPDWTVEAYLNPVAPYYDDGGYRDGTEA